MAEELVSVIVPVYNVEQYLPRCLQSIVSQTYSHLEIIVVDDGSTDGSGLMCDQWAQRDQRIHVVHKANGGLSDARNVGLDMMHGSLVMMVDSDDWLHTDAIATLLRLMHDTGADIAVSRWHEIDERQASEPQATLEASGHEVFSRQQVLESIFYQQAINHSSCGRLFKAELFDGIRYPVGRLYEDLAIAYPLYGRASKVVLAKQQLYNYLHRKTSILGHFKRQRTDVLDILDHAEQLVARQEPILVPAVRSRRLSAHFNILLLCPGGKEYDDITRRCWNVICQLRWPCLLDGKVRAKNKLGILASLMGKRVFTLAFHRLYISNRKL